VFVDLDVEMTADLSDQEIQRYSARLADAVAELLEGRGQNPCRFTLSVSIMNRFKQLRSRARELRQARSAGPPN
jgi:hypothetical protein